MRISLKAKLIGAFLAVALLVVIAGGVGLVMISLINGASSVVVKDMAPVRFAAMSGAKALGDVKFAMADFMKEIAELGPKEEALDKNFAEYEMWVRVPALGTKSVEFLNSPSGAVFKKEGHTVVVPAVRGKLLVLAQKQEVLIKELEGVLVQAKKIQHAYVENMVVVINGLPVEFPMFVAQAKLEYLAWDSSLESSGAIGTEFTATTEPKRTLLGKWINKLKTEDQELKDLAGLMKKQQGDLFKMTADMNKAATPEEKQSLFYKTKTLRVKLIDVPKLNRVIADLHDRMWIATDKGRVGNPGRPRRSR